MAKKPKNGLFFSPFSRNFLRHFGGILTAGSSGRQDCFIMSSVRKVKVQRKQMYFNHLSFRQWLKKVRGNRQTAKHGLNADTSANYKEIPKTGFHQNIGKCHQNIGKCHQNIGIRFYGFTVLRFYGFMVLWFYGLPYFCFVTDE